MPRSVEANSFAYISYNSLDTVVHAPNKQKNLMSS